MARGRQKCFNICLFSLSGFLSLLEHPKLQPFADWVMKDNKRCLRSAIQKPPLRCHQHIIGISDNLHIIQRVAGHCEICQGVVLSFSCIQLSLFEIEHVSTEPGESRGLIHQIV